MQPEEGSKQKQGGGGSYGNIDKRAGEVTGQRYLMPRASSSNSEYKAGRQQQSAQGSVPWEPLFVQQEPGTPLIL